MAASLPEAKSANGSYSGWQPELSSRRHAVVLQGLPDQHAHDYGRRRCALAQTDGGAWMKERPGDTSEYSNAAFGYLAPLIAREAGMTFPDFSKTRIFETLDMKNTAWFRRDLPQAGVAEAIPNLYSSKTDTFTESSSTRTRWGALLLCRLCIGQLAHVC